MRRLQRKVKVQNAEQTTASSNVSGSLTFDRRTFFECSNRMKRLVPTLSRRQTNVTSVSTVQDEEREISAFGSADEEELPEQDQNPVSKTQTMDSKCSSTELTRETAIVTQKSPAPPPPASLILQERHSNVEVDTLGAAVAIATLPRTMTSTVTGTASGSTATLPTSFSSAAKPKSSLGRRIWLKPLTSFVTFMSNIGDNIHITSYPSP